MTKHLSYEEWNAIETDLNQGIRIQRSLKGCKETARPSATKYVGTDNGWKNESTDGN